MKILLLNPNSTAGLTSGMELVANDALGTMRVEILPYTAPSPAPSSINNGKDIACSTTVVMNHLAAKESNLQQYDAILVACFSVHDLVPKLADLTGKAVTGLFEASILTSLSLISPTEKWGIVTTGQFWEQHLRDGVDDFLGVTRGVKHANFAGVFSTGLSATEFHSESQEMINSRLDMAVRRLLQAGNVTCVVLGCGGMVGLESTIRSAAAQVIGLKKAKNLFIIDGVRAGIMQLYYTMNSRQVFSRE